MFATAEEKLVLTLLMSVALMVGSFGFAYHERKAGAAVCVRQDQSAALSQAIKDSRDAHSTVAALRAQLQALPTAAPAAVSLRMCIDPPRSVRTESASTSIESTASPHIGGNPGLQTGNQSGVDIGAAVQDITLAAMLCTANSTALWQLAVKEGSK